MARAANVVSLRGSPERAARETMTRSLPSDTIPERMGYRPVRKAERLGVHKEAAEMCWVSRMPSLARLSMLGVLRVSFP